MKRLKILSAAVIAVMAVTAAIGAGSALAAAEFRSEAETTTWSSEAAGSGSYLELPNASLKCSAVTMSGSNIGKSRERISGTPSISSCKYLGTGVAFTHPGCKFTLDASSTEGLEAGEEPGSLSVECGAGEELYTSNPACSKTKILPQSNKPTVTYTNQGSGTSRYIHATAYVGGITYTGCGGKEHSDGVLVLDWNIKGSSGAQVGVSVYSPFPEGPAFNAEAWPTNVTGTATTSQVLKVAGATATCSTATYYGRMEQLQAPKLALGVEYPKCNFLFVNTWLNPCKYVLRANGQFDIQCEPEEAMQFTAAGCTVTINSQSGLPGVTYTTQGTGSSRTVKVKFAVTGIKYTATGIGCPKSGTLSDGTYSGEASFKAATGGFWQL